jgi:hypothetical protein
MCAKISPKGLRWWVWSLFFILLLTIGLSWGFYPEKYNFFREAVSFLGGQESHDLSLPNFTSSLIFSIGFVILGIFAIILSIVYILNLKRFRFAVPKGILLFIIGIGAAFTAIPWDISSLIHGIGAFLFISGIAVINFVFQLFRYRKRHFPKPEHRTWDFYWDLTFVILLFAVAAFYFVIEAWSLLDPSYYFINTALTQKIVLFAACIAILLLDVDDVK